MDMGTLRWLVPSSFPLLSVPAFLYHCSIRLLPHLSPPEHPGIYSIFPGFVQGGSLVWLWVWSEWEGRGWNNGQKRLWCSGPQWNSICEVTCTWRVVSSVTSNWIPSLPLLPSQLSRLVGPMWDVFHFSEQLTAGSPIGSYSVPLSTTIAPLPTPLVCFPQDTDTHCGLVCWVCGWLPMSYLLAFTMYLSGFPFIGRGSPCDQHHQQWLGEGLPGILCPGV